MWRRAATKGAQRSECDKRTRATVTARYVDLVSDAAPEADEEYRLALSGSPGGRRPDLELALMAIRSDHASGVFSSRRMIDPLLDLWSLASSVDRSVARPLEAVLTSVVERSVITASELMSCIDGAEAALARLSA